MVLETYPVAVALLAWDRRVVHLCCGHPSHAHWEDIGQVTAALLSSLPILPAWA